MSRAAASATTTAATAAPTAPTAPAAPAAADKKKPTALEVCQSNAKKNVLYWKRWVLALAIVSFLLLIVAIYYAFAASCPSAPIYPMESGTPEQ